MVERYTLKNGMPVFIVETQAAPVVSIQAWFTRGSVDEGAPVAGISHFLEHSLFKGTKKRKVGEIAMEIEAQGGEINAFTSFEETAYYATLASRYFSDGLDVIADAVQNPSFDPEEMLREREVILEEIKRAQDSPYKILSQNLWKTAFSGSPYSRPVLGFVETVSKIDHRTLKRYFSEQYHAGSAALIIVGDVDKGDALQKASKLFSKMRRGKSKPHRRDLKPELRMSKVVSASRDLSETYAQIAIPVPGIRHAGIPALDLMCSAVGQGESSPLYQELVKNRKVALDVNMGLVATSHCGLASVGISAIPENLESAIRSTYEILEELGRKGIDEEHVERVKSSTESDVVGGKETVDGYARRLGYYFSQFGDPEYEKKYLEQILGLDAEDATEALRATFSKKAVLSVVHPSKTNIDTKSLQNAINPISAKPAAATTLSPKLKLSNAEGVKYVTKEVTHLPIVSLKMIFPGGSREETKNEVGLANLFRRVWNSGTTNYNSLQIAHALESLGASIHAFSGRHTTGLSIEFLSKHWSQVKPILGEILLEPTFPEDELETERRLVLREILSEKDSPGSLCQMNFLEGLYGDHPYGRSSLGTKESVSSFGRTELKNWFTRFLRRGNTIVSSVGNFKTDRWVGELGELMRKTPGEPAKISPLKIPALRTTPKVMVATKQPLFQSHVMLGFLGSDLKSPHRYALKLLSSCLAGQGGRLFLELRDKQSLAYQVSPISNDSLERGMFAFYIGCSPEKIHRALTGIRLELEKVLDTPIGKSELDRAKKYWIGRFELDMQRYSSQAMTFGLDEMYGLGADHSIDAARWVKNLTSKDIQTAAQELLTPDHVTISVVHPEPISETDVLKSWQSS